MKKVILIFAVAIATMATFSSCQKEYMCTDQNGQVYDCDANGNPTGSDCGCTDSGDGTFGDDGWGGEYGKYYLTKASSFEAVEVDISGACDGKGTETWTMVTLFSDPYENTGPYTVVYTTLITREQFGFSNDTNRFFSTSLRDLDNFYSCAWDVNFDLPFTELLSWWE